MSAHTPGPWKFGKELTSHAGEWLISIDAGRNMGNPIAETRTGTGDEYANARLIAAAPKLLEALQKIIDMNVQYCIDRYGDSAQAETMSCVTTAREAISKATGGAA